MAAQRIISEYLTIHRVLFKDKVQAGDKRIEKGRTYGTTEVTEKDSVSSKRLF
jgi:hypothetical protein